MAPERLDRLLVSRGFAESREKAQRLIRTGRVRVDGQVADKPGRLIRDIAGIDVEAADRYVSRGGEKLEGALARFPVRIDGRTAIDVGSSTGGFTDCLLQQGASRVYAVDVGAGQLHWKLRRDPRVIVREKTNARYLRPDDLPESPGVATIDVSFISLTKVLPAVTEVLASGADLITLIKPQFEAGRKQVGKGGVVRDPSVHETVVERIRDFGIRETGLGWRDCMTSPLKGPAGNVEFLAWWTKS